jgi:hypothetical protein
VASLRGLTGMNYDATEHEWSMEKQRRETRLRE